MTKYNEIYDENGYKQLIVKEDDSVEEVKFKKMYNGCNQDYFELGEYIIRIYKNDEIIKKLSYKEQTDEDILNLIIEYNGDKANIAKLPLPIFFRSSIKVIKRIEKLNK